MEYFETDIWYIVIVFVLLESLLMVEIIFFILPHDHNQNNDIIHTDKESFTHPLITEAVLKEKRGVYMGPFAGLTKPFFSHKLTLMYTVQLSIPTTKNADECLTKLF